MLIPPSFRRLSAVGVALVTCAIAGAAAQRGVAGCLEPREIPLARRNVAPQLEAATRPQPI